MPGVGKTTIAKVVAEKLQWKVIDTDTLVEQHYTVQTGKQFTCRQIALQEGLANFRKIESEIINSLAHIQNCVIATGGGTLLNSDNVKLLKALGVLIYIKDCKKAIRDRLFQKGIPSYIDKDNPIDSFDKLFIIRTQLYEKEAHYTLDKEKNSIEEIISEICRVRK